MGNKSNDFPFVMWDPDTSVVFRKTNEEFGGLSNMAAGFPLEIHGRLWRTSEALYQALRFPDHPDVQEEIRSEASPMAAKMKSKPHRASKSRLDWDDVRVDLMYWCLEVKLFQNQTSFGELLRRTGNNDIVESSAKDNFWGAIIQPSGSLYGQNVLGRLLMRLRARSKANGWNIEQPTPTGHVLTLFGRPVNSDDLAPEAFDGTLRL
jgi:ribA/ribD-fused uncharacterized protein